MKGEGRGGGKGGKKVTILVRDRHLQAVKGKGVSFAASLDTKKKSG
jgi:hypothetical protein